MIIKSQNKHKIGDIINDEHSFITDNNGNPYHIPFMILDKVTREDYIKECEQNKARVGIILDDDFFYKISVD